MEEMKYASPTRQIFQAHTQLAGRGAVPAGDVRWGHSALSAQHGLEASEHLFFF